MKTKLLTTFAFVVLFMGIGFAQSSSVASTKSETQKTTDVVVFPNPASDFASVSSKNALVKIKTVKIYSIIGVEVASYIINQNQTELQLGKLKPGKYLIRFEMGDGKQLVKQLVKQ